MELMLSGKLFSGTMALKSIFSIYQWLTRCYFVIKEDTHFHFFIALTPETNFSQPTLGDTLGGPAMGDPLG
jgi:hypothetical protein